MFDLDQAKAIANDPNRNGEGWYCCDCGEVMRELIEEYERLRTFYDSVCAAMHEHAGNLQDTFAYMWQCDWDKIKAAEAVEGSK